MFEKKIRIQAIKERIGAIELLQDAGQQSDAEALLKKLAEDILNG